MTLIKQLINVLTSGEQELKFEEMEIIKNQNVFDVDNLIIFMNKRLLHEELNQNWV